MIKKKKRKLKKQLKTYEKIKLNIKKLNVGELVFFLIYYTCIYTNCIKYYRL